MPLRLFLTISTPTQIELMRTHSPVAMQARRRGNAAGFHGRGRYGKQDRQRLRREERNAHLNASRREGSR